MPRRRSGVTAGRLRKVGAEIGIDASDALAGVAALINKVQGSETGRQAVGQEFKRRVIMPAGFIGKREVQDLVPKKTGRLERAIFVAYGDPKKPNVLLGVRQDAKKGGAPYAHIVEYGSVRSRPKPFFRSGITAARSAMAASMITNAKKFITE